MFCVNCGEAYEPFHRFCNHCGYPLPSNVGQSEGAPDRPVLGAAASVSDAPETPVSQAGLMPGPPPLPPPKKSGAIPLKTLVGLAMIGSQLIRSDYGFSSAVGGEAVGYDIFAAVLYAIGAIFIYQGLGGMRSTRVTVIFGCLGLALACMIALPFLRPTLSEKDIPRLMAEAAGRAPIPQPDNDGARIARDFLREVLALRQEAGEASSKIQTPVLEHLMEPLSFSSREKVQEALDQLNVLEELSHKSAQAPKAALEHLHAAIAQLTTSPYASFLKEFETGAAEALELTADMHQKEEELYASEIDIYQFVLRNLDRFSVTGDRLAIADDETLNQYNAKLANARRLAKDLRGARTDFEARNSESEKRIGFSFP